ncbi:MAG: type III-A CRISPR-associated protein Cas10/Csm1, partial [Anaerovoracaceae bacterium]
MEKGVQVIFGSLLHDCGKVLYRHSGGERHSKSGQAFLKDRVGITDEEILNQVLYHHSDGLKGAKISTDSLAYITYIADNIASGVDRRSDEESGGGWKKNISLNSIFNLLNENRNKKNYAPGVIDSKGTMNLPIEQNLSFDQEIYGKIEDNLLDGLKGIKVEQAYQNSLLQLLEANLSFVPSSTSLKEVADISLFDHCKLTGAIASCILIYMESQGRKNYKEELYRKATNFYNEKAFTMCSFDLSGIQEFIYTVGSKNALKTLRARSFYLEILAEHIADELLVRLGLSRANLLYTGGGHGYLLLPSSNEIEEKLTQFID